MAVYTEVSDAELEAFLQDYDIGSPESFKGIAEGVENTNYVLTTTRGQCQQGATVLWFHFHGGSH